MSKQVQQPKPQQDTEDALIDTMMVCASKDGRVFFKCSMHGRHLYFPMTRDDASRTAAELVYYVTVLNERDAAAAAPKGRKK
jgi:hypothetical protein